MYFKISGYGKCSWSTLIRRDSAIQSPNNLPAVDSIKNDRREHAIQYSGHEEYLSDIVYLTGSKNGKFYNIILCHIVIYKKIPNNACANYFILTMPVNICI